MGLDLEKNKLKNLTGKFVIIIVIKIIISL